VSEAFVLIQMVMLRKRGGKGWRERGGREGMAWRWVDELFEGCMPCMSVTCCLAHPLFHAWLFSVGKRGHMFWLLLLGGYLGGGR